MFLTLHSKGKYILHGWGYDELDPPNVEELQAMGNIAVKAMSNKFGGYKYKLGGAAKLLYPASGNIENIHSLDFHSKACIKFCDISKFSFWDINS